MTEPARSSDARQKMYLMEGERLVAPWIHNAMGRRDDEVGCDKRTCAPTRAPVAGRVDLADGTPGCAQLLNHSSIVITEYTGLRISCGCAGDGERERDTDDAYSVERA